MSSPPWRLSLTQAKQINHLPMLLWHPLTQVSVSLSPWYCNSLRTEMIIFLSFNPMPLCSLTSTMLPIKSYLVTKIIINFKWAMKWLSGWNFKYLSQNKRSFRIYSGSRQPWDFHSSFPSMTSLLSLYGRESNSKSWCRDRKEEMACERQTSQMGGRRMATVMKQFEWGVNPREILILL